MDSVNTNSSLRAGLKKQGSIACSPTSINTLGQLSESRIYPNPTDSKITIERANGYFTLKLYNTYGKLLSKTENSETQNTVEIDIHQFNPGIYLIEIETQGQKNYYKIIKN